METIVRLRRSLSSDCVVTLFLCACVCMHAGAQSSADSRSGTRRAEALRAEARRRDAIFNTAPRRPTGAPRRDNITDEEVREVQRAATAIYPDAIVNISTVTEGCDCQDEDCSAQLWLVLYRPNRTRGLMLSKIGGHWQIGAVQDWWLRYYDLRERMPAFNERYSDPTHWRTKLEAWQTEEQDLVNSFPVCKAPAKNEH